MESLETVVPGSVEASPVTLRPAQARALAYTGGRLAISAVPGAGKTFILTQLAGRLIRELGVPPRQILILTYMRSAAENFRRRIAEALAEAGSSAYGLQAMTIHAFCLGLIKQRSTWEDPAGGDRSAWTVITEIEQRQLLRAGLEGFLASPAGRVWLQRQSRAPEVEDWLKELPRLVSLAKLEQLAPEDVIQRLGQDFLPHARAIAHYLETQQREGLLDYDDQVRQAIDWLERDDALRTRVQARYRFVFEDEAQDSTPMQARLVGLLTDPDRGGSGNLVRVGDSNQSITTTFTFNDPRFFRKFCSDLETGDRHIRMDESSRSAPEVIDLANDLLDFASRGDREPLRETFLHVPIRKASAGKANPVALQPPTWTLYRSDDEERDTVLLAVRRFLREHPEGTAAVLLFSNAAVAHYTRVAETLAIPMPEDAVTTIQTAPFLDLLETVLALLAHPAREADGSFRKLCQAWLEFRSAGWQDRASLERASRAIRIEDLVYPEQGHPPRRPADVPERDYAVMLTVAEWMRLALENRARAIDDWLPTLAETFVATSDGAALAARVLGGVRRVMAREGGLSDNPWESLRLHLARFGQDAARAKLHTPEPSRTIDTRGQLRIMTMHASKGDEFDAVWIPGLGPLRGGRHHFPGHPGQAMGQDVSRLIAETRLARRQMHGVEALREEAGWEGVRERLRLLYVAITRAERALHLSGVAPHPGALSEPVARLASTCQKGEGP